MSTQINKYLSEYNNINGKRKFMYMYQVIYRLKILKKNVTALVNSL